MTLQCRETPEDWEPVVDGDLVDKAAELLLMAYEADLRDRCGARAVPHTATVIVEDVDGSRFEWRL